MFEKRKVKLKNSDSIVKIKTFFSYKKIYILTKVQGGMIDGKMYEKKECGKSRRVSV